MSQMTKAEQDRVMPGHPDPNAAPRQKVIGAALVGTLVEYYEFAVYSYLATVLAIVFFSQDDPTSALLSTLATLAVAFLVRPIGAILFGSIGDRIGRKTALSLTLVIMTVATLGIGLLPGYATVGIVATIALVLLRAVQGLSTGGELAAAVSFVAEHARVGRRGFTVGLIQLGMMFGTLLGSATVAVLTTVIPEDDFLAWGWRLPFIVAAPVGLIGLYIRWKLEDAPVFQDRVTEGAPTVAPVRELFGSHLRRWAVGVAISTVSVAGYWVVFVYMPIHMQTVLGYDRGLATGSTTFAIAVAAVALVFYGHLGDRIGRKRMYAVLAVGLLVGAYPLIALISSGNHVLIVMAQAILGVFAGGTTSVLNTILAELFPTSVRTTGIGLAFNTANILAGGTAPFIVAFFVALLPGLAVPALFVMLFAAISLIALTAVGNNEALSLEKIDSDIAAEVAQRR